MNKTEFIAKISETTDVNKKDVKAVIDILPEAIKESVITDANNKFSLIGFATFEKRHVEAKSGTTKIGGVEKAWTTEPKDVIAVKLSKSYKKL